MFTLCVWICVFVLALSAPRDQCCVFTGSAWLLNHAGSRGLSGALLPVCSTRYSSGLKERRQTTSTLSLLNPPSLPLIHSLVPLSPSHYLSPCLPPFRPVSFTTPHSLTVSPLCFFFYFFPPAAPSFCPVFLHFIFISLSICLAKPILCQPLFLLLLLLYHSLSHFPSFFSVVVV